MSTESTSILGGTPGATATTETAAPTVTTTGRLIARVEGRGNVGEGEALSLVRRRARDEGYEEVA